MFALRGRIVRGGQHVSCTTASSAPFASARAYSNVLNPLRANNPALRATIFGAYGFVGRYVTNLLGECRCALAALQCSHSRTPSPLCS
jgi:hypothetical protein